MQVQFQSSNITSVTVTLASCRCEPSQIHWVLSEFGCSCFDAIHVFFNAARQSTSLSNTIPSQSINLNCAKILKVTVRSTLMRNLLKTVLNRWVVSSVLKLVTDEADRALLGREFHTYVLVSKGKGQVFLITA